MQPYVVFYFVDGQFFVNEVLANSPEEAEQGGNRLALTPDSLWELADSAEELCNRKQGV